jgi:tetratricopeptide (TPR) repeat protein
MSREGTGRYRAGTEGELSLVLADYLAAIDRGEKPDREALLARHAQLAEPLRAFFAEQDRLDRLAERLRFTDSRDNSALSFDLLEEISRGGMGVVLRGHDRIFDRDLAIKVLPEHYCDRPDLVRRFIEEARITGQLQHPFIVPVHELGYLSDGRPYFAMKLVKGRTLAELLRERLIPVEELPRFLKIFEQICQTIAYAHSKGVIHRDLKPSNVMVGTFAEVQVMDWGLAKLLIEAPAGADLFAPASPDQETEPGGNGEAPDRTQAGSVLGTFAFMPPEQAQGEVERVNRRSDVFGLGAILCEILTGQPPYTGERAEVKEKARMGRTEEALGRLDGCGADAELIELAKRCLATDPAVRPADSAAVADAMAAHFTRVQERLLAAEMARARAETEAVEERKRVALAEAKALAEHKRSLAERRRQRASLLMVAALLLLVVVAAGFGLWFQRQRAAQASEAAARSATTERDATAALSEARLLREEGLKQSADTQRWGLSLKGAGEALKRAENALALGEPPDALRAQVAAERAEWEQDLRDCRLFAALEQLRLEAMTVMAKQIRARQILPRMAAVFRDYGLDLEALAPVEAEVKIRANRYPDRLRDEIEFWAQAVADVAGSGVHYDRQFGFKGLLVSVPDWSKAEYLVRILDELDPDPASFRRRWRDARVHKDVKRLIALAQSPEAGELSSISLCCLAADLTYLRDFDAARELLRQGHERYPSELWLNLNLGMMLLLAGPASADDALRYFTAALAVRGPHTQIYLLISYAFAQKGDEVAAFKAARTAIELDPQSAPAQTHLALFFCAKRDWDSALPYLRKAAELDPDYALPHANLGNVYLEKKDFDAAIPCLRRAIECDPSYASAHLDLANALVGKRDLDGAIKEYHAALALFPNFALAHNNLAQALACKQDFESAERSFRAAIQSDPTFLPAYYHLGDILATRRDFEGAIRAYQGPIEQNPKSAEAHYQMARLLLALGRAAQAEASLRKTIELDAKYVHAHCNLASLLASKRDWDGAIASYRTALKLDDRDPRIHDNLGIALYCKEDLAGAIRCHRRALELDPEMANAHHNLGIALLATGDSDGAAGEFRAAIKLNPKAAKTHLLLAQTLLKRRDADGAVRSGRAALALDPQAVEACTTLAAAMVEKGDYAEALSLLRRGQSLLPLFDARHAPLQQLIDLAQRFQRLEQNLPAILGGEAKLADALEQMTVAMICARKHRRHVAAARFFSESLAAGTGLPAGNATKFRYLAACSAVLAGTGQATDDADLDAAGRRRWRNQAREWLRTNLAAWSKLLESGQAGDRAEVQAMLWLCQKEPDFAAVRDPGRLADLPAQERDAWLQLWRKVEALARKAAPG